MSAKSMGQAWDLDLPHNELLVLLAMTDHADHDGKNIYPSMGLIAWKTGYSERQVRRVVQKLVQDGILVLVEERAGSTKKYRFDASKAKKKEAYKAEVGQNVTPDIIVSEGVGHPDVTPTPDIAMSYEPSVEPSDKPSIIAATPKAIVTVEEKTAFNAEVLKPQELLAKALQRDLAKGDWGNYGGVCKKLALSNITPELYPDYVAYIQKRSLSEGSWKITVNSLVTNGRMSDYWTEKKKPTAPRPVPVVIAAQTTVSDSQQADALAILQAARGGLAHVSA